MNMSGVARHRIRRKSVPRRTVSGSAIKIRRIWPAMTSYMVTLSAPTIRPAASENRMIRNILSRSPDAKL